MKFLKPYNFLFLLSVVSLLLLQHTGCQKEYSFEDEDTIVIVPDTAIIPPLTDTFSQCSLCHKADELILDTWSFKTGNAFVCGTLTNPGFIGGNSKTAITVFGPSACSLDTGMVISIYLPVPLDQDRVNITASGSAFYYYDRNSPKDIFLSNKSHPFSVTIQSYIQSTGIVTGTFMGTVLQANGDTTVITDGNFLAKLH